MKEFGMGKQGSRRRYNRKRYYEMLDEENKGEKNKENNTDKKSKSDDNNKNIKKTDKQKT
jgi:hypothetical protein